MFQKAKTTNKLAALMLALALLLGILQIPFMKVYATEVIPISTETELKKIGNDDAYPLSGNYMLTADISMDTMIVGKFTGVFDGYGHTITLSINNTSYSVGLFEEVSGTVENLITAGSVTAGTNGQAGAIAGTASSPCRIIKCWNQASVSGGSREGASGIIGFSSGAAIEDCLNTGEISGTGRVGGITCVNPGCVETIKRCFSSTCVSGNNNKAYYLVGGENNTKIAITDCYYAGNVDKAGSSSGGGTKLSGESITKTASYTGWDFNNTWIMKDEGPRLRMPVTSPTAKSLTYTASEQKLVNEGFASGGTLYYAVTAENVAPTDETLYSIFVPAATGAGTYYVWYYAVGNIPDSFRTPACVEVSIAKADPTYTVPTGLTAAYGDTLADVTLPSGWTWTDSTASVGNVGTNTFKATFTPADTANYNVVSNLDVNVSVSKATATIPVSGGQDTSSPSVSIDEDGVTLNPMTDEQLAAVYDANSNKVTLDFSEIPGSNHFEAHIASNQIVTFGKETTVSCWLRGNNTGTLEWYGFETDADFFKNGAKVEIDSLDTESKRAAALTDAQRDTINKIALSDSKVYSIRAYAGGSEVHSLGGGTINFRVVDKDNNWEKDEMGAVYLAENGDYETVPLTFEPKSFKLSGGSMVDNGSLTLFHISVYMLYRKAPGAEAVINTDTKSYSSDQIFIEGVAGQEYIIVPKGTSITDADWNNSLLPDPERDNWVFFENLKAATEYEIYTRTAATDTTYASDAVKANVYTTLSGIESDYDSTLAGATITIIPEPETEGLTYKWYQDVITEDEEGAQHHALTEIVGATGASYTFRAEDEGKYITVKIFAGDSEVGDTTIAEPVALSATVEFDSMGGSKVENATGLAYRAKLTKPADPTREGYAFDGWYWDEEYEEAWDFENEVILWTEYTLYAKWTPNDYTVTSVSGLTSSGKDQWTKGGKDGVVITVKLPGEDNSFDHFTGVKLDGVELVKDVDYTVEKGSTIVTLLPATLEKLSVGEHTVTVFFDNGEVNTTFTILAANSGSPTFPQTGDNSHIGLWIAIMILSLFGLAATLFIGKKRVYNR